MCQDRGCQRCPVSEGRIGADHQVELAGEVAGVAAVVAGSLDSVATCGYTLAIDTVGIRELKNHLSEYVRRVRAGERIRISSHGEVVAELRSPEPDREEEEAPPGLLELVRRGTARAIVRNDPSQYRTYERALTGTTARELLDWDRGDR